MTDDERQARVIISRWITKKTGVSPAERGMRKFGDALREFGAAVEALANPIQSWVDKWDESKPPEGQIRHPK